MSSQLLNDHEFVWHSFSLANTLTYLLTYLLKETFETEQIYLNSMGEKSKFISVTLFHSNFQSQFISVISGFCSQVTKEGST